MSSVKSKTSFTTQVKHSLLTNKFTLTNTEKEARKALLPVLELLGRHH